MLSLIYCIRWSSVQDTRTKRMCSSTSVIALFVSWETWLRFDPEPPLGNLVPSFQRPTSSAIKGWKSNHVSHVERHTWFRSKLSRDDLQHRKPNQLTSSLELIKGGTFRISIEWDTCRTPTQTLSICSCTECQPNFGIKSQDRKLLEQFFLNFNEIRTFSGLLKCKKHTILLLAKSSARLTWKMELQKMMEIVGCKVCFLALGENIGLWIS